MPAIKNKLGWVFIVIITAIPLLLWYHFSPLSIRFGSKYATLISIGQMLSLTGFPLFAQSIILSGRFWWMEDFFGGMNRVYIVHHIIGGTAFILLMVHPLFMGATRAMISLNTTALFFIPGSDWSINFGIFAILSMMTLLVLTYFINLKYHIWKYTHKFMGAAFFLAYIHACLIESDISRYMPLRVYMLGLGGIALCVYVYRTLLGKWLVKKYDYRINYVTKVTKDSWKIEMTPLKKPIRYRPGQFVFIQFLGEGVSREWHPFSISSAFEENVLDLIIKSDGDFTAQMDNVKPGMTARIEGSYGRFFAKPKQTDEIWIAGGIGITPFLSKAKSLKPQQCSVDLYYIVHGFTEAAGHPRFIDIAKKIKGFRYCLYDTTAQKKRITAEMIDKMSNGIKNKDIFICGPPPMMASLKKQFKALKIPASRIHTEEFSIQ